MPKIRQWHAFNVAPAWHLFSAKRGADLLCGALLARFVLIMGINAQRHIDCGVSCEILNLLDIQPAFKQPCDVGMPELVRTTLECSAVVQRSAGSSTVRLSIVCRIDLKLLLDSGLPFLMCSTYRLFAPLRSFTSSANSAGGIGISRTAAEVLRVSLTVVCAFVSCALCRT